MTLPITRPRACRPASNWSVAGKLLAPLLLVALASGCVTSNTRPGADSSQAASHPAVSQARDLARNAATLAGAARKDNDRQIESLLAQLDDATLARESAAMPVGDALYNYAGRALLHRGLPLPRPFDRADWHFSTTTRPAADADGYRPPTRLAVLLPLSGSLASAASPVRDGLLAGYYGETRRRPEIVFYDTSGSVGGALGAYDRAVSEGSDFVVGPLGRDEVDALFARDSLSVPVLALNRGSGHPPSGNASFSLSPEDEGIAAAELLLARGAKRVLVIAGSDDSQRRATASLRDRLGERGAVVTDVTSDGTADFAPFAQKEGGIDAIFLAVKGDSARALTPRLALAGLAGKPRVATSQLLAGTGKADLDMALDGIAFPTEAWNNRSVRSLGNAASVAQVLPTARAGGARLFAFGHDAWLLTAYLEHLALAADGRVDGATGTLRIDGFGNVLRTPAWSTFNSGVVVPLSGDGLR
ncbi:penicillin-binding protein activator [Montanilutibacter psychrotolerans]|nr:penicillin-binding protein activator [Lysobacter psychrotolerans]